jgi:hypothetical protein
MRIIKSVIFVATALSVTGCEDKQASGIDGIVARMEKGETPTLEEQEILLEAILNGDSTLLDKMPLELQRQFRHIQQFVAANPWLKDEILKNP